MSQLHSKCWGKSMWMKKETKRLIFTDKWRIKEKNDSWWAVSRSVVEKSKLSLSRKKPYVPCFVQQTHMLGWFGKQSQMSDKHSNLSASSFETVNTNRWWKYIKCVRVRGYPLKRRFSCIFIAEAGLKETLKL